MDIYSILKERIGNRAIEKQNPAIKVWKAWYKGKYRPFHNYSVQTGNGVRTRLEKSSLGMAKAVSEAWADLLMNENTKIVLPEKDDLQLQEILSQNNFNYLMNDLVEKAYALSCGAVIVGVNNLSVDGGGNSLSDGVLKIQYIDAEKVYPITFENGKCTECAFVSSSTTRTTISIHLINENGVYEIRNSYYKGNGYNLTFESEEEPFITNSTKPFFTLIKPAIANNLDLDNPMGISIYANAIDQLKSIDNIYDSLDNEFILGKKRLYISTDLDQIDSDGNRVRDYFDPHDVLVYHLPVDSKGNNLITSQSDELRAEAHVVALNGQLSTLSVKCGLGKGYFTFNGAEMRLANTATEVMAKNADLFRTIKKHEKVLEQALKDIVEAIIFVCNNFTAVRFSNILRSKIRVIFDDSIFEDKESVKESDRKDVNLGALSLVEYRMKHYGETEEEATAKIDLIKQEKGNIDIESALAQFGA